MVVEAQPGTYRLYVGKGSKDYCHYDTGYFGNIDEAAIAARQSFNPEPFNLFPWAPYARDRVLEEAPDAWDDIVGGYRPERKAEGDSHQA